MTEPLDGRLVAALCRDGRADVRDIAAATDAVPTTVQKRLRALEENGTIGGYTALIDYGRLGYETVLFRLDVDLEVVDEITDRLRAREGFVTVYQTGGPDRVFAVGKFASEAALAACLRELHDDPTVRGVDADTVASVHREGGCPLPNP
jgi:DNA-binding Lrp family transcriptional regulator